MSEWPIIDYQCAACRECNIFRIRIDRTCRIHLECIRCGRQESGNYKSVKLPPERCEGKWKVRQDNVSTDLHARVYEKAQSEAKE